jgi:hypothetical protein
MIHLFAGMVSDKSAAVLRVSSFLLLALTPVVVRAQGHQLKIRIINANTGQPVTNERLNVALRVDQVGSVAMPTDKKGIIAVDLGGATTIRILSNMYADCRPRAELYTNYPVAPILQSGLITGNLCPTTANPHAKPGELILFEIPRTIIPSYPAPPLPPPPQSY